MDASILGSHEEMLLEIWKQKSPKNLCNFLLNKMNELNASLADTLSFFPK